MSDIHVLIAAYGPEALEKIASLPHPEHPGVDYIVSWQRYDRQRIPEEIKKRQDFRIHFEDSTGLCRNRNALMGLVKDGIAVIADDDLAYIPEHFENIRHGMAENPHSHFLSFRYSSENFPKTYPSDSFPLSRPPKGYFVTSMEMVFNLDRINQDFGSTSDIIFDTDYGVNGHIFGSGEEDILVHSLLKNGYKATFVPEDICINTESTTSERIGDTRDFIATKGAVMLLIKPYSWPLRMLTHAWRSKVPFFRFCRWWLGGVRRARGKNRMKIYYAGK